MSGALVGPGRMPHRGRETHIEHVADAEELVRKRGYRSRPGAERHAQHVGLTELCGATV